MQLSGKKDGGDGDGDGDGYGVVDISVHGHVGGVSYAVVVSL